jgi:hypothetical protein
VSTFGSLVLIVENLCHLQNILLLDPYPSLPWHLCLLVAAGVRRIRRGGGFCRLDELTQVV